MTLTLGSLFDGIGGWPDAAIRAGVKPLWASEIEPFPAAVTAHHYPGMKQLGDITKINVDELEPVDIICAGSPCQDLSVAGKRKGLAGERGGAVRTSYRNDVKTVGALMHRDYKGVGNQDLPKCDKLIVEKEDVNDKGLRHDARR